MLPEKMDSRSWLWRRKSSEKSPGETESSGGSMSSHSERFSDEQIFSNQSSLSPEVTSKAELPPEELEDGIKILSEKLSAALVNISIKEDLVKQHSKVAEEAVEGWEKAENEVSACRRQIEVLTLRNSTLEDRVCQLDGALKECLRQLRQTREEKNQKLHETIEKKTSEWQITKTELENQLSDLHSQLRLVKKPDTSLTFIELEKENSALKRELASMAEDLEMRFIERELSNQAAEQASKLHLESAKKAVKFEAECRKLNRELRKALAGNDQRSFTDSHSIVSDDSKETNEINLMDDFIEMERYVALPKTDLSDSLRNRVSEVEEILKRVEVEKRNFETALNHSENELKNAEMKLFQMEALLNSANNARETTEEELKSVKAIVDVLQERVRRSESETVELKSQLDKEQKETKSQLEAAYVKKNEAESQSKMLELKLESLISKVRNLESEVDKEQAFSGNMRAKCRGLEVELESLILKVDSLETEVEKERALSKKMGAKSRDLEGEISRLQLENQYPKPAIQNAQLKMKQDIELALASSKFSDCQKTIASLSQQLKTLATLEDFLIDTNEFNRRV